MNKNILSIAITAILLAQMMTVKSYALDAGTTTIAWQIMNSETGQLFSESIGPRPVGMQVNYDYIKSKSAYPYSGATVETSAKISVDTGLGPGVPIIGVASVMGSARQSGGRNVWNGAAIAGGYGNVSYYFTPVNTKGIPGVDITDLVLPIHFAARGEVSIEGGPEAGGFGQANAYLGGQNVSINWIAEVSGLGRDSFDRSISVESRAGYNYLIEISAGGTITAMGEGDGRPEYPVVASSGTVSVAVDPSISFDQAAFDEMYGDKSFPLDEYFRIEFSPNVPSYVRIAGSDPLQEFDSLQAAYDAASSGAVIEARECTFKEDLNINQERDVSIRGGFATDYVARQGYTTLQGVMTVSKGMIETDRLIVK